MQLLLLIQAAKPHPAFGIGAMVLLISATLFLISRSIYQKMYWEKGIFPPNLKFTNRNLMRAQIAMATLILRKDRSMMLDKMLYVDQYFRTHFRDELDVYRSSYSMSMSNPIQPETVAFWLNKNDVSSKIRLQFVQFLMNISVADGVMNRLEFVTISKFIESLKLDQSILNDFVNSHYERQQKQEKKVSPVRADSVRKKYSAVLGLVESSPKDEIKKTYRRLVKLYHPDRFQQETVDVQRKSKEKFQELQQAYDWLMEN